MAAYTFDQWKAAVLAANPTAQFTEEDGSGCTYGEQGDWTAHTGPDMQADVVGVYTMDGYCSVFVDGDCVDHTTVFGN